MSLTKVTYAMIKDSAANVQDFGAVGDGVADDTAAIQAALDASNRVYVPTGVYLTKNLTLNSNQELFGDGVSSVLKRYDNTSASQYIVSTYSGSGGTSNPADNKKNIYLHDIRLDGRMTDFNYDAFKHNLNINATSNMIIERVSLYNFMGDGCYLGSGNVAGIERHNLNITFKDCTFDGISKNNRNGLSVIDCDVLTVDNCDFKNIGNATLSRSVGGIDFEPNDDTAIYRHIKITNCQFKDIDSVNTSGITFFNGKQIGDNIYDWVVDNCSFIRCYWGISAGSVNKLTNGFTDGLAITNCFFQNSTAEDIRLNGLKSVAISDNTFNVYPNNSSSYRGGVQVGFTTGGVSYSIIDVKITNNSFNGLRPQFGCVSIRSTRGLRIDNNSFEEIQGACVQILTNVTAGFRYLEDIVITKNKVESSSTGVTLATIPTTGLVVATTGVGNEFINSTCVLKDNIVLNNIQLNRATTLAIFRDQPFATAPTSGTWAVGDKTQISAPSAGAIYQVCSVAGTFGTLTGVTATATNGSNKLEFVAGTDFSLLREEQYITVSGDATVRKIILIDGTNVYLSGDYAGVSGAGLALAWSAPTFVSA